MNNSVKMDDIVSRTLIRVLSVDPEWLLTCEVLLEELSNNKTELSEEQGERLTNAVHDAVRNLSRLRDWNLLSMEVAKILDLWEEDFNDGI